MILFSKHAEYRLHERQITKQAVKATIVRPDYSLPTRFERTIVMQVIDGRNLKVVFVNENNDILVLTAYWTQRVKP